MNPQPRECCEKCGSGAKLVTHIGDTRPIETLLSGCNNESCPCHTVQNAAKGEKTCECCSECDNSKVRVDESDAVCLNDFECLCHHPELLKSAPKEDRREEWADWEDEFDDEFVYYPPGEKLDGGTRLPPAEWKEKAYIGNIKSFIRRIASQSEERGREDERNKLVEMVKGLHVGKPRSKDEEFIYTVKLGWVFEVRDSLLATLESARLTRPNP